MVPAFQPPVPLPTRATRAAVGQPHRCRQRRGPAASAAGPPAAEPSPRLRAFLSRAREGDPLQTLARADAAYTALKARGAGGKRAVASVVTTSGDRVLGGARGADYDVVVAGGTLGIVYATALQRRGWRVCVVERGPLAGRTQEWNISRTELGALVDEQVVDVAQLDSCVATEWTAPGRIGLQTRPDAELDAVYVSDVLNVGVSPARLVEAAAANFVAAGGVVLDRHALQSVRVGPDGARLSLRAQSAPAVSGAQGAGGTGLLSGDASDAAETVVTTRLLIDAMGAFSPIAEQARGGRAPDGVCVTVGSCMRASYKRPVSLDVLVSRGPVTGARGTQYFWEAFPAGGDAGTRTTYMFAYGACDARRPTLVDALEDYLDALPAYQGVDVTSEENEVLRVLFGFFPSYYRDCPTDVAFDRVLPVGDAGGLQSPISFGGFGCCLRHLSRVTRATDEALRGKSDALLKRGALQALQWYLPSLSVTGLFHRAMSVPPGATTPGPLVGPYGINRTLWANMQAMASLGPAVQLPFLRDVVTAPGLARTLLTMVARNPRLALVLPFAVGVAEIADWSRHFVALLAYDAARPAVRAAALYARRNGLGDEGTRFWLNRAADAVYYGSGADAAEHAMQAAAAAEPGLGGGVQDKKPASTGMRPGAHMPEEAE